MRYIKLTQGLRAKVDDEDFERLSAYKWYGTKDGYAVCSIRFNGKRKTGRMHRVVLGIENEMDKKRSVDHINGDGLDNRKSNLRFCTPSENQGNRGKSKNNTSGYKGVYFVPNKRKKKWVSMIGFHKKFVYIGHFLTAEEAAEAYNKKAQELRGEFSKPNVILQAK